MHGAIHALTVENTEQVHSFNCDDNKEKEKSDLDLLKHQPPHKQRKIQNILCFDVLEDKVFTDNHLKTVHAPKIEPSKETANSPSNINIKNSIVIHNTPMISIPLAGKTLDGNGNSFVYRWIIHQRQYQHRCTHTTSNVLSETLTSNTKLNINVKMQSKIPLQSQSQLPTTALFILNEFSKATVAKSIIADILTNICGPDACPPARKVKRRQYSYSNHRLVSPSPWSILCPLIKRDEEEHKQGSLQELLDYEEDMWGEQLDNWISKSFGVKKSATKPQPKIILTVR